MTYERLTVDRAKALLTKHGYEGMGRGDWVPELRGGLPCPLDLLFADKIPDVEERDRLVLEVTAMNELMGPELSDGDAVLAMVAGTVGIPLEYADGLNNGFETEEKCRSHVIDPDSVDYKAGFADGQALTSLIPVEATA